MDTRLFFSSLSFSSWQIFSSNDDSRLLIQNKSDKLEVLSPGQKIRPGLFMTDIKAIYTIKLSATTYDISFDNIITTQDGIRILGKISCVIRLIDDNEKIKKVFLNEKEELTILKNLILDRISDRVSYMDAKEVKTSIIELNKKIGEDTYYARESCFEILSTAINNINLEIKEIDNINSNAIIEEEKRKKEIELHKVKRDLANSENNLKESEAKFQILLEKEREKNKIEAEFLREKNKIAIEKLRKEAELEIKEKENQIEFLRKQNIVELLKSEEGKIAENPELWYKLQQLVEETKALSQREQQSFAQEFIKNLYDNKQSFQQGQLTTLKKVVEKVFNIQTPDYDETASNPILDSFKNLKDNILNPNSDNKPKTE